MSSLLRLGFSCSQGSRTKEHARKLAPFGRLSAGHIGNPCAGKSSEGVNQRCGIPVLKWRL
eukprot:2634275-Pyramimonas_sp.AAC.1